MARFVDAIDLPIPIEEAFDYLSDFSRTAEWDPSVTKARRITRGEIGLGSRFEVTVSILGRALPLEYEITEFTPPHRLVIAGGDDSVESIDEITFAARHGGTRITYEACVELVGLRRIVDPLLDVLFQRVGSVAARGLRERIAEMQTQSDRLRPYHDPTHRDESPRKPGARRTRMEAEGAA